MFIIRPGRWRGAGRGNRGIRSRAPQAPPAAAAAPAAHSAGGAAPPRERHEGGGVQHAGPSAHGRKAGRWVGLAGWPAGSGQQSHLVCTHVRLGLLCLPALLRGDQVVLVLLSFVLLLFVLFFGVLLGMGW